MTDRVPGAPGRCTAVVTGEDLRKLQAGEEFAITLRRDDQPIKEGTPYSKAAVLPDALASRLCPGVNDPAPKDAFDALHQRSASLGDRCSVLEARVDNFIALPEGSTTADAELMDIRVGIDETFPTAGEAVRRQIAGVIGSVQDVEYEISEARYYGDNEGYDTLAEAIQTPIKDLRKSVKNLEEQIGTGGGESAGIVCEATGNVITLKDSANGKLQGLHIYGGAWNEEGTLVGQKGNVTVNVMGKNIANLYGFSANGISSPASERAISNSYGTMLSTTGPSDVLEITQSKIVNNNAVSYANGYFCIGFYHDIKDGDTVSLSFDVEITNNLSDNNNIVIMVSGSEAHDATITSGRFKTTLQWANNGTKKYIEIRNGGKSMIISNIQVEYGATATAYEPYNEQVLTVPTPFGLDSGDDGMGSIVDDEIDFEKGVYIKRLGSDSVPLEKPVETPLPAEVMDAYNKLHTYKPNTTITNDENAPVSLAYVADTKIYIDNKFNELAATLTALTGV